MKALLKDIFMGIGSFVLIVFICVMLIAQSQAQSTEKPFGISRGKLTDFISVVDDPLAHHRCYIYQSSKDVSVDCVPIDFNTVEARTKVYTLRLRNTP